METRKKNQSNQSDTLHTSFIFAELNATLANQKINSNQSAWLLRESSVPGLLTVSYYNADKHACQHQRLGFLEGKWQKISANRDTATLFAKNQPKLSFVSTTTAQEVEQLTVYLESLGFKREGMIYPAAEEASKSIAYTAYTNDLNRSETSADRYMPF